MWKAQVVKRYNYPLSDTQQVSEALSGAQWVFHLAGAIRGAGSETAQVVNQETTEQLIEAVLQSNQNQPGGFGLYQHDGHLWRPFRPVGRRRHAPRPETDYARSKVAAETGSTTVSRTHQLPIRIARLAAVYGLVFRS